MSDALDTESLTEPPEIKENSSVLRTFLYDCLFCGTFIALLYILDLINDITADNVDKYLSLYPRDWKRIWAVFTCTFVHDDMHHLNSYVALYLIVSICILTMKGRLFYFILSIITILFGNLLSWCIGIRRMNGISGWSFGLLSYIYLGALLDLGLPAHCSIQSVKSLTVAVIVTAIYCVLYSYGIISTSTASWQYNLCGIIGCIISIYIIHIPKVSRFIGLPEKNVESETPVQDKKEEEHRVVVGKNLMKFSDLRKPLV